MIKIKEKKQSKKKQEPVFSLKIEYMIGDADGYTSEEMTFPVKDADVIEKFCRILDKLEPVKGTWGISLNEMEKHHKEGQITDEQLVFWDIVVDSYLNEQNLTDELEDFADEYGEKFNELVRSETEYSFLVYQDYKLKYIDENGIKHNTYFE